MHYTVNFISALYILRDILYYISALFCAIFRLV
nr:MAG TPA: hypothetical protein [Caudoviricetes sp.]